MDHNKLVIILLFIWHQDEVDSFDMSCQLLDTKYVTVIHNYSPTIYRYVDTIS